MPSSPKKPAGPNLFALLVPYRFQVAVLLGLAVTTNALNLALPKIISHGIDAFSHSQFVLSVFVAQFVGVVATSFVIAYGQAL